MIVSISMGRSGTACELLLPSPHFGSDLADQPKK